MPDKDDTKKQQQEALIAEALQRQERMKLEAARLGVASSKKIVSDETTTQFVVNPAGIDWEAVRKAYKAAYGEDPKNGENLEFASRQAALIFFADLAKQGLSFLAEEMVDGVRNGFHVFSFGNGKLYSGTLDMLKEALEADLQQAPDNKKIQAALDRIIKLDMQKNPDVAPVPNPATELRGALKEHRRDEDDLENSPRPSPPTR